MATLQTTKPRRFWLAALSCIVCIPLLLSDQVRAAEFAVSRATTQLRDEVYYLNADLNLRLTGAVVEAVESGVPITIELQIEVVSPRDWWWDETVYSLSQRYRVKFHALTRQYVVTNLNSRVQNSYPTRTTALTALSSVKDLPILDRTALKVGVHYFGTLRARLAVEDLPSPLRVWAYLSSDWDLASDKFRWQLQ